MAFQPYRFLSHTLPLLLCFIMLQAPLNGMAQYDTAAIRQQSIFIDSLLNYDLDSAEKLSRINLTHSQEMQYQHGIICSSHNLVRVLEQRGSLQEARALAEQNLLASLDFGNDTWIITTQTNLANIYKSLGLYEEALKLEFKSLEIAQSIRDTIRIAHIYNETGKIYAQSSNHERAMHYFTQSAALNDHIPVKDRDATSYSNVGITTYILHHDIQKARELFDLALKYMREQKNHRDETTTLSNVGQLYMMVGNFDTAKIYFTQCLRQVEQVGQAREQMNLVSSLAHLYLRTNKIDSAILYYRRALRLARDHEYTYREATLMKELGMTYQELGQKDSALVYYALYAQKHTRAFSRKTSNNLLSIEYKYFQDKLGLENENLRQKESITLLELKNEQSENQVASLQLRLVGVMALLLLILLIFILRINRNRKKHNYNLQQKNEEIEAQKGVIETSLQEKETLLREIHHRVKNNLQVVSSLLNLQSHSIHDHDTLKAVKEGQNRVKSMALIHKKLYQSDQLTNIDFQEYLEQLGEQLCTSYGISPQVVQVQANQALIDVDTAVPLGLIVNELVTNALKYALQDVDQSVVKVELSPSGANRFVLTVQDQGQGLPSEFQAEKSETLGLRLVYLLSKQIKAKLEYKYQGGALFSLQFSHALKVNQTTT